MHKAIVTGANGFVGSAVCKELVANGVEVIAIVRSAKSDISNIASLNGLSIVNCDLSEYHRLTELISDRNIDVFYHFAWMGTAGPKRGDSEVQINNIKCTCDAIKVCAKIGCRKFVFASSIMEFEIDALMKTEMSPSINTIYSSAKLAADYMIRALAASEGVAYIRALISNIYGPGELSPRLINTSIRKLLAGEYCTFSSGEQMYDFVYVTDAAKMLALLGEQGISNRTYYIGSQNPRPLREFLLEMQNIVNSECEIGLGKIPFDGVALKYDEFDLCAVEQDTGFVPQVSFDEGIRKTMRWIQEVG